jgi:hypothetical protein
LTQILTYIGSDERVSFAPEVEDHGLRLCPCDMNRSNFMRDSWGRIVALDFGDSCFLPLSFFAFALREGDYFTQLIARKLKHPASTQLNSMLTASYALVPLGTNEIGKHISLLSFLFHASRSRARRLNSMYCTGIPRELKRRAK